MTKVTVSLTQEQIAMLRSAIDSHIYWQLAEPNYRNDGDVLDPGSDEEEDAEAIGTYRKLDEMLAEAETAHA